MNCPDKLKLPYSSPLMEWGSLYYDCLIADSSLETIGDGDEWIWEE